MSIFEIVLVKTVRTDFDGLWFILKVNMSSIIVIQKLDQTRFGLASDHNLRVCPGFLPKTWSPKNLFICRRSSGDDSLLCFLQNKNRSNRLRDIPNMPATTIFDFPDII